MQKKAQEMTNSTFCFYAHLAENTLHIFGYILIDHLHILIGLESCVLQVSKYNSLCAINARTNCLPVDPLPTLGKESPSQLLGGK